MILDLGILGNGPKVLWIGMFTLVQSVPLTTWMAQPPSDYCRAIQSPLSWRTHSVVSLLLFRSSNSFAKVMASPLCRASKVVATSPFL